MDPALTELATSGAQTIVRLMATDAWQGAKKLVARIFVSQDDSDSDEIMRELETSRHQLISSGKSDGVAWREQDRWDSRLRLRLLDQPAIVSLVEDILRFASENGLSIASGPGSVSIQANATGNAKVYQQGHGVQHNS